MNPQVQAIVYRFVLGLVITEIPIATAVLANTALDYRLLGIGLLGGLATALEKYLSPQLASVVLPNAVVMPDTKPATGPTVATLANAPGVLPPH